MAEAANGWNGMRSPLQVTCGRRGTGVLRPWKADLPPRASKRVTGVTRHQGRCPLAPTSPAGPRKGRASRKMLQANVVEVTGVGKASGRMRLALLEGRPRRRRGTGVGGSGRSAQGEGIRRHQGRWPQGRSRVCDDRRSAAPGKAPDPGRRKRRIKEDLSSVPQGSGPRVDRMSGAPGRRLLEAAGSRCREGQGREALKATGVIGIRDGAALKGLVG